MNRTITLFIAALLCCSIGSPVAFALPNQVPEFIPVAFDSPRLASADSIAVGPDGTMYVAGNFSSINGVPRNGLAAISAKGELLPWNPKPNKYVSSIWFQDSVLYIGGSFTEVDGKMRNRIAAIDTKGKVTDWDPNANASIGKIVVQNGIVYVIGSFTKIGGQDRNRIAAIDTKGKVMDWNPSDTDGFFSALAVDESRVYVGGTFTQIGDKKRKNVASFDKTGALTDWDPEVMESTNKGVSDMVLLDSIVYIAGSFYRVDGQRRRDLAAIDGNGKVMDWDPGLEDYASIHTLLSHDSMIYVGGIFMQFGEQNIGSIAAIDTKGVVANWAPKPFGVGSTDALTFHDSSLYVGGTAMPFEGNGIEDRSLVKFAMPGTGKGEPRSAPSTGIHGSEFQKRTCDRVQRRFAGDLKMMSRINDRLIKQFSFKCG